MEALTINRQPIPNRNRSLIDPPYNERSYQVKPDKTVKPSTQYTKSGDINIAYQVFGTGPIDLVYIPGWVSNIDWMWECPELVGFLMELGKIARIILFDKRGTGLSDRVVEFSTLEERMDDIQAVMDAAGSEKAVLFGHSEGGSVSTLFAATYPNKVISLITFGVFAKRRYSSDYPWAPTDEERQKVYDMIEHRWGCEKMELETLAPSKANDPVFMNWLSGYFRFGASPNAAMTLTKINTEVNIINILGAVKVPTLILQRTNDIDVKIEEGKFMAQKIKGSKFVELNGDDHLFWVGNTVEVLNEMKTFISASSKTRDSKTGLITVLSAKTISSHKTDSRYELICSLARQYRGKIANYSREGFTIIFQGPGMAVNCGINLSESLKNINIDFSAGIYMKEGSPDEYEKDSMSESIVPQTYNNQIIITQAVKNLLSGAGFTFLKSNTLYDPLTTDLCTLYEVKNEINWHQSDFELDKQSIPTSFLENIIKTIEKHVSNEFFGLEILSIETGISQRQLQRKIKGMTNKSPNQLISAIRLNKSKELLLLQKYSVAEIAFKTGFSSPSYFSKCFKKEFGVSPTSIF